MDKTVGEDLSGVNSRSEVEAMGVGGDGEKDDDISLSPEEFAGENERRRGRICEREGGGEGEGEDEGVGEGERESGGDKGRDAMAEEDNPEVDAPEGNVENWDATEPGSTSTPRITRTGTCL
jgi:hypothetical protein